MNRYYEAEKFFDIDQIVRITADCPLLDPYVMDKVDEVYFNGSKKNCNECRDRSGIRTYHRGLDLDVFSFETLSMINNKSNHKYQREHVTPYIYQNLDEVIVVSDIEDSSNNRWTVDKAEDMEFVRAVYSGFKNELDTIKYKNILDYLD